MIFIQTFWSKPFLNLDSSDTNYRSSGGFIDKRYFYYCWVLSYLCLERMGRPVILFTDDIGKYLLVELLELGYSDIRLDLNEIEKVSSAYWAIPKLLTYSKMDRPFLHIDGDLLLYSGFEDLSICNHGLIFEFQHTDHSRRHAETIRKLHNIVAGEDGDVDMGELNCGVAGGHDYTFFNEFADYSLTLFYRNQQKLDSDDFGLNSNLINTYFEQVLMYNYIGQKQKKYSCLFEGDPAKIYLQDFFLPEDKPGRILTHFYLNLKSRFSLEIEMKLMLYYPDWYAKINDLIARIII